MKWSAFPKHLRPPGYWRAETKRRVEELVREYDIRDAGGLLILRTFGDAETRELDAREQIAAEGQVVADRFGQRKPHPLLCAERDARTQKLSALRLLDLETDNKPGGA